MRLRIGCRKILKFLPTIAATLAAATPISAVQSPAPRPEWTVDHGALFCSLVRARDPAGTTFAIRTIPGTERFELLTSSAAWRRTPLASRQSATLVLTPGGESIEAQAIVGNLDNGNRMLAFVRLPPEFLVRFAQATRLQVTRGERTLLSFDFPSAARAARAFRQCVDQTLTDWGIDLAVRAGVRQWPVPLTMPFDDHDYPDLALRAGAEGQVAIRLTIGVDGRASSCSVVRGADEPALDRRTCQNWRQIGRFRPALDENGQPIQVDVIATVVWRISG